MSLARDVANELARQQRRKRNRILAVFVGLVILAVLYLRFGGGWGLGGDGARTGSGTGDGARTLTGSGAAAGRRCVMKVAAGGTTVDGKTMTLEQAVAACSAGADFVCVGDARQGDCDAARAALDAAHVPTYVGR